MGSDNAVTNAAVSLSPLSCMRSFTTNNPLYWLRKIAGQNKNTQSNEELLPWQYHCSHSETCQGLSLRNIICVIFKRLILCNKKQEFL